MKNDKIKEDNQNLSNALSESPIVSNEGMNGDNVSQIKEDIEEQYEILKDEQEKEEKRRIILLIALFLLIFGVSFTGATFSYMSYKKNINSEPNKVENPNNTGDEEETNITVLFNAGNEFVAEDIMPGWESTTAKVFSVENNTSRTGNYNVVFQNIKHNFENPSALVYYVKCNGEIVIPDTAVPTSEKIVLENQAIPGDTVNSYEIYYKFLDTGTSQDTDKGKSYKMSVMVEPAE